MTGLDQPPRTTRRVRRRRLGAATDGSAGGRNRRDEGDTNCSDHDEEFERDSGRQRLVTRQWTVETVTKPVSGVVDGVRGSATHHSTDQRMAEPSRLRSVESIWTSDTDEFTTALDELAVERNGQRSE
mgnify:CR=1 FL=1